ncbi:MAG: DNA-binding response regulator [Pseudopedobacter saltans]|uniref:DNA-binding response regulator n=1 Tax=Pseudopedobacter saltans TaxID=151895 RepID=A0A2W5EHT2_9SPHI|nr:MAG: DNA-binding response regulator [Pseudopedobacter saltans]
MIKAILVDDEHNNIVNLSALLNKYCPQIEIIGSETDSNKAVFLIKEKRPDLIFLDIQMPGKSGFEVLEAISYSDLAVVFVTAYDNYGIQALRVSAVDYILKPIDIEQLKKAVERVEKRLSLQRKNENLDNLLSILQNRHHIENHRIAIAATGETRFVYVREIVRCESDNSYTFIHLENGEKLLSSQPMHHYESILVSYGFIRTHQSHLVNRSFVKSIIKKDGQYVLLTSGDMVPISRYKLDDVKKGLLN